MTQQFSEDTFYSVPFHALDRIFDGIEGSPWLPEDETPGRAASTPATYGELTATGARDLVRYLNPTPNDVFCDIGAGAGRLVLQVAASARLKRCMGVEFIQSRHAMSIQAQERAQSQRLLATPDLDFVYGDAREMDYGAVTIAFLCATCFPQTLMAQLAPRLAMRNTPLTLVTLAPFPEDTQGFHTVDQFTLSATWTDCVVAHVYLVLGDCA